MALIRSRRSVMVQVADASQVGEARRTAAALAAELPFDDTKAGRINIVATELAGNIIKHTRGGELVFNVVPDELLEVLAIDRGPGMNISECLRDGFSSTGTAGTGLGAVRRLSDEFDAYSMAQGTVLLARFSAQRATGQDCVASSSLCVALRGERVCGDASDFVTNPATSHRRILVVDGLGHGPQAAQAATAAIAGFRSSAERPLPQVMEAIHLAMRTTRGGSVFVGEIDLRERLFRHSAVGNISGCLTDGVTARGLVTHAGTVGAEMRKVQEFQTPWPDGGVLVTHTDGVNTRWDLAEYPGLVRRHPGLIAGVLFRDFRRERDDSTVVVCRGDR